MAVNTMAGIAHPLFACAQKNPGDARKIYQNNYKYFSDFSQKQRNKSRLPLSGNKKAGARTSAEIWHCTISFETTSF
jgi:hypothetical protein